MRASKAVLKILTRAKGRPVPHDEVIAEAGKRGIPAEVAEKTLSAFAKSRRVTRTSDGAYVAFSNRDLVVGRISVHRKGYGFVEAEDGDVYVRADDMAGALHRDTVAVRLTGTGGGRMGRSGQVSHVVDRANETVVGRFEVEGRIGVVTPTDRRIRAEVMVPGSGFAGAARGDIVVARITRYPTSRDAAQGVIEEVLGPEGAPGVDIETIIREHGLRTAFPAGALDEAALVPADAEPEAGRKDLRDLLTITIDPADARDYDDAISVRREAGGWRLWVHIADVAHYVPWGGAIDLEARRRATSVYLVDRVLPMLPEHLSNGVCSLKPHTDRLTMTVEMLLDKTGLVESFLLYPSIINSDHRFAYEEVDEALEKEAGFPDEPIAGLLRAFRDLAAKLGERRIARGGLDFETVEAKVALDPEGRPTGVSIRERTVATNMIEEAMILANEVVSQHMVAKEAPMVFRIHEDPDPDALAQIAGILTEFQYPVREVRDARPATFQKIVKHAHGRPEQLLINSLLLRALKRARYADFLHTHFGLASTAYTHFTSPIRRYPDLLVHRLLKAQLSGALEQEPAALVAAELEWLAEHSSEMEREAEAAENDSVKLKLTELMAEHLGEEYDGVITGVSGFGFFVQLPNTAEGLVHVEALADDYYIHDAERFLLQGENAGRTYRLGQQVRVRIVDVIVSERRIELEPA